MCLVFKRANWIRIHHSSALIYRVFFALFVRWNLCGLFKSREEDEIPKKKKTSAAAHHERKLFIIFPLASNRCLKVRQSKNVCGPIIASNLCFLIYNNLLVSNEQSERKIDGNTPKIQWNMRMYCRRLCSVWRTTRLSRNNGTYGIVSTIRLFGLMNLSPCTHAHKRNKLKVSEKKAI